MTFIKQIFSHWHTTVAGLTAIGIIIKAVQDNPDLLSNPVTWAAVLTAIGNVLSKDAGK